MSVFKQPHFASSVVPLHFIFICCLGIINVKEILFCVRPVSALHTAVFVIVGFDRWEQLVVKINWTVLCFTVCLCVCVLRAKIDSRYCRVAQCSVMQNIDLVIKQKGKKNQTPMTTPAIAHLTGPQSPNHIKASLCK